MVTKILFSEKNTCFTSCFFTFAWRIVLFKLRWQFVACAVYYNSKRNQFIFTKYTIYIFAVKHIYACLGQDKPFKWIIFIFISKNIVSKLLYYGLPGPLMTNIQWHNYDRMSQFSGYNQNQIKFICTTISIISAKWHTLIDCVSCAVDSTLTG